MTPSSKSAPTTAPRRDLDPRDPYEEGSWPVPPDEAGRIATLHAYQVLDTPTEITFDALIAMARMTFETPMVAISLVDEFRQWFKASVGLDEKETPRDRAFCARTIMEPHRTLYVRDARLDPRFRNNPLVTGPPYIRFYAGAPIRAPNGAPLGTFCVESPQPRTFSARDARMLELLAEQAAVLLEARRGAIGATVETA